jgi:hypothetical protein
MSVRGNILNFQAAQEWVRSLQLIDVVFADAPDVLKHWHELYLMLQQQEAPPGQGHKMIDLLSAMAAHLGFKTLTQTDIDKAHYPRAISDPIAKANDVQEELLRVLKKTDSLLVAPIQPEIIQPQAAPLDLANHGRWSTFSPAQILFRNRQCYDASSAVPFTDYFCRSATRGSMRAARRAGM